MKIKEIIRNYKIKRKNNYKMLYAEKFEIMIEKANKNKIKYSLIVVLMLPLFILSGNNYFETTFIFLLGILLAFFLPDVFVVKGIKKRNLSYEMEMPNFLDRIVLMLDAGLTIWEAIDKASFGQKEPLYIEIQRALNDYMFFEKGINDLNINIENMAQRCKSKTINTFVALIVQNSRKGSKELIEILRVQSVLCRNERKNTAQRLGKEATTLMLIPSGIVFLSLLVMLIAPAIMQINFK